MGRRCWVAVVLVGLVGCKEKPETIEDKIRAGDEGRVAAHTARQLPARQHAADAVQGCKDDADPKTLNLERPFEEQVAHLKQLFYAGKFDELHFALTYDIKRNRLTRAGWYYPFSVITRLVPDGLAEHMKFGPQMNAFTARCRWSATVFALRSLYFDKIAWKRRGGALLGKTSSARLKKYQEAKAHAEREADEALKLDPDNPVALYAKLQLLATGSKGDFEDVYTRLVKRIPTSPRVHQAVVRALAPQWGGSAEQCLGYARAAASEYPDSALWSLIPDAHGWIARANLSLEQKTAYKSRPDVWKEVQQAYGRVAKNYPTAAHPHYELGVWADDIGRKDEAAKHFRKVRELEPKNQVLLAEVKKRGH